MLGLHVVFVTPHKRVTTSIGFGDTKIMLSVVFTHF